MAKYKSIVMTKAGLDLLENAAFMGSSIQFTVLKTGNGTYDGTEDLVAATDLKNVCQTFGVGSVSKMDEKVIVRTVIDNNDLTEAYEMTELGLYANSDSGEVLYAIILAEEGHEDYVPPYADAPTSITFEAFFELTESEEAVTFEATPMEGVYVPVESFEEHVKDEGIHVTEEKQKEWDGKQDALTIDEELDEESENLVINKAITVEMKKKLNSTGNASDTTVAFKEATELEAPISGSKLSTLFGIVAKAVKSLISHLADTIGHITSAERTNWNDANSKKHTHSNKTVLDNTTASYTTDEKIKLSGIASGANKYTHPNSGVTAGTYRSVTVNAAGHVTGGSNPTLPVTAGGTGQTTAVNAANAFINALSTGSDTPKDADYIITQYVGGGTTTTTYHRRPLSALWTWIKGKADSLYAAKSHGNHVPDTQTASNKVFLRNDNTWQTITPANIGAAASAHNQAASTITDGTLAGKVQANATAQATLNSAQVRDIYITSSAITEGGSSSLANGTIVFTKG